jgi:hypothetical protein
MSERSTAKVAKQNRSPDNPFSGRSIPNSKPKSSPLAPTQAARRNYTAATDSHSKRQQRDDNLRLDSVASGEDFNYSIYTTVPKDDRMQNN